MRLGGPVFGDVSTPEKWVAAVKAKGYRAANCPLAPDADDATVRDYVKAARAADIVIAETGAWSNPLAADDAERAAAFEKCTAQLALAERVGARCCVNIAGSRGAKWDGPDAKNLTSETFDMIVEVVRNIIDAVKPARTSYTLEPMPWMYPDSAGSYERLLRAVGRDRFAVHFDPVNLVSSVARYYDTAGLVRDFCARLGPRIKSVHAKDIILREELTTHLDEVRPGLGGFDYPAFLREIDKLDPDMPLLLEHLPDEAEYDAAAAYVRGVARGEGIAL